MFTVFLNAVVFSCTPQNEIIEEMESETCCGDDNPIPPPPPPGGGG